MAANNTDLVGFGAFYRASYSDHAHHIDHIDIAPVEQALVACAIDCVRASIVLREDLCNPESAVEPFILDMPLNNLRD